MIQMFIIMFWQNIRIWFRMIFTQTFWIMGTWKPMTVVLERTLVLKSVTTSRMYTMHFMT